MCNQIICRSLVVALVCALPMQAFAQMNEELRLPALDHQVLTRQIQAKPRDQDKDTLKNGAIIGAIVMGTWCLIVCGQGLDTSGQLVGVVAVNAGMGALVGAGIDARFRRGNRVMFRWRF